MPRHVLIIPDKFKGTLTAAEAARAIARGWLRARPQDTLTQLPMSDGGDGFGDTMRRLLGARRRTVTTVDAAHRPCQAPWWHQPSANTAIIESARIIGLAMLPPGQYHPFELDTFGLGEVLHAVARAGCRTCIIGIGGSATNDGGFGLARAFGWRFLDRHGRNLLAWTELPALRQVVPPQDHPLATLRVVVAVDVQNPLLGLRGATRIYGPQKGIRPEDVPLAEQSLRRLARRVQELTGRDLATVPGSGAAGGLGFGLQAFAGARVQPGFDLFATHARLTTVLRGTDLVITGEGAMDCSTAMGKGVGEIARRCRRLGIPCIGLGGRVSDAAVLRNLFTRVHAIASDLTSPEKSRARPAYWLSRLSRQAAATTNT